MKTWLAAQQSLFSQHIHAGNLPHAILISGVKGSGKKVLATWLTRVLQCNQPIGSQILEPCQQCKNCKLLAKGTYPDHLDVISDKNTLGVDHIRQASLFFEKTAQIGVIKTVLIPDAQTMTIAAANALLKTLEEPTDNSVIVLLSNEHETLLPTIISRCRLFEIRPPSGNALLSALGKTDDSVTNFSNLTHLPELMDAEIAAEFNVLQNEYVNYLINRNNKSSIVALINHSEHGLRWLEGITINLMRRNAGWEVQEKSIENSLLSIKSDTLWHISNKITDTITKIKTLSQANSQFLVEKLMIDIDHILMNE